MTINITRTSPVAWFAAIPERTRDSVGPSRVGSCAIIGALLALGCAESGQSESTTSTETGSESGLGTGDRSATGSTTNLDTGTDTGAATDPATGAVTGVETGPGSSTLTGSVTDPSATYPECTGTDIRAQALAGADLRLPNGDLAAEGFSAEVSVDAVCDDRDGAAPGCGADLGTQQRLTLASASGEWTLEVSHPSLGADFFTVGETLSLEVATEIYADFFAAVPCQSLQLWRGEAMILLAHTCYGPTQSASHPDADDGAPKQVTLGPLALADAGILCAAPGGGICGAWYHQAQVSLDGAAGTASPGSTLRLGTFDFTLASYEDAVDEGNCDGRSIVRFIALSTVEHP